MPSLGIQNSIAFVEEGHLRSLATVHLVRPTRCCRCNTFCYCFHVHTHLTFPHVFAAAASKFCRRRCAAARPPVPLSRTQTSDICNSAFLATPMLLRCSPTLRRAGERDATAAVRSLFSRSYSHNATSSSAISNVVSLLQLFASAVSVLLSAGSVTIDRAGPPPSSGLYRSFGSCSGKQLLRAIRSF